MRIECILILSEKIRQVDLALLLELMVIYTWAFTGCPLGCIWMLAQEKKLT